MECKDVVCVWGGWRGGGGGRRGHDMVALPLLRENYLVVLYILNIKMHWSDCVLRYFKMLKLVKNYQGV